MKKFVESNPGLKSRFANVFYFEDSTPDQLLSIFKKFLEEEEYIIEKDAEKIINDELLIQYRQRDKFFGNARLAKKYFDQSKINLSRRILQLPSAERNKKVMTTIIKDDLSEIINKDVQEKVHIPIDEKLLEDSLNQLNSLIGLENIKKEVTSLVSSLKMSQIREERGLKIVEKNLHSVFMGNPGTGKTSVARLLSRIYKALGLLEKGHLVEVDRAGLVAGFQGQTAIKTDQKINDALGGTLFIDEAYMLSMKSDDFGQEAIATLLKRMEDFKDQFIVIAAGYTDQMRNFIDSNPGLQSRFSNYFYFDDFTSMQLLSVIEKFAVEYGYKYETEAIEYLRNYFNKLYETRSKNFGNARDIKNLFFKSISNQEQRLTGMYQHSDEDLITLKLEDIRSVVE
jgi:SpoVK/Ycf46/Vps4 family AAA+-type ATPase